MIFSLLCAIIVACLFGAILKFRSRTLPHGPTGLPFIGVAHKINPKGLHYSVSEWSDCHGDVISFKVFGKNFVALNSYESIYDGLVLRSTEFAGRPYSFRKKIITGSRDDIISGTFTTKWLAMKKLAMQTLKTYGPNQVLEEISAELIQDMIAELTLVADTGEAADLRPVLHRCTTAIITSILYGRRMEDDSISDWLSYENDWDKAWSSSASGLLLDIFPWTRHLHISDQYQRLVSLHEKLRRIIGSELEKSRKNYVPNEPKCFIDGLFQNLSANLSRPEKESFKENDVFPMMYNMTAAGTITTSLTLTALVACLINKPDIQQKLADEIKSVIGDRPPCLEDKPCLPYVEATIMEILRYHTLVPLNLPHATTSDLSIGDFDIPKGTSVFFNLWKLHHDSEFWEEPWEFKPERFLDNGKLLPSDHQKRRRLLAFGAGRRVCPGEAFAKKRLFLMVTSLLQKFRLLPETEDKRPNHDPRSYSFGFNLVPLPYKVKLSKRF